MNKGRLIKMMEQEGSPSLEETQALNEVVQQYPYFQVARVLQLKGLHSSHSFFYNAALRKTAVHTADRRILFDYITGEAFLQHGISAQIKERNDRLESEEDGFPLMSEQEADQVLDPDLFTEEPAKADRQDPLSSVEKKGDHIMQFKPGELHTFSEWLQFSTEGFGHHAQQRTDPERERRMAKEQELIDKFIEASPKIIPSDLRSVAGIPDQKYGLEDRLMTETLAEIYVEQKKYDKAIQAYRILILKNPEKSGLFADRIYQIEKIQEKQ